MVHVVSIQGAATLSNGESVQFSADAEGAGRWGGRREDLGAAVDVTDGIPALIREATPLPSGTMKLRIVSTSQGVQHKLWPEGEPEPEEWTGGAPDLGSAGAE